MVSYSSVSGKQSTEKADCSATSEAMATRTIPSGVQTATGAHAAAAQAVSSASPPTLDVSTARPVCMLGTAAAQIPPVRAPPQPFVAPSLLPSRTTSSGGDVILLAVTNAGSSASSLCTCDVAAASQAAVRGRHAITPGPDSVDDEDDEGRPCRAMNRSRAHPAPPPSRAKGASDASAAFATSCCNCRGVMTPKVLVECRDQKKTKS